jgi:transposase
MPRPYSLDLRERVVAAVSAGASCRSVAARFQVSVSSVVKWCQRARATGTPAAKRMGGYRRSILEPEHDWLVAQLAARPDQRLADLRRALWEERGVRVSVNTLWRYLQRSEFRFKKKPVRQRAGQTRRGPSPATMEEVSG